MSKRGEELMSKRGEEPMLRFTRCLEKRLSDIVEKPFIRTTGKHSIKREKMWSVFYQFRAADLFFKKTRHC